MAASEEYEITWESKPLGFSIVMDTTGRNAYVSSIQNQKNLERGLKLAAQIIAINGVDVKQQKHAKILDQIKKATLPMVLKFQPRSFATEPADQEPQEEVTEKGLLINGGPEVAQQRVNGIFLRTTEITNGKPVWQRKDNESDPVLLWFWPASVNKLGCDLWMIGRQSQLGTDQAYACCNSGASEPVAITGAWKIYDKEQGKYVSSNLQIAKEVSTQETSK